MPATQIKKRVAFKNILLMTDFSSAANSAIPYAAGLSRCFEASLCALHVREPVNYALPPELWQEVQQAREVGMQQLREELSRDFPELNPIFLEGEGRVRSAAALVAEKHAIDLIVVGTHGRTGIGKALLGSQAEEIIRHASCPVLTVGPHVQSDEKKRGKFASILFATDFGQASLEAAPIAVSLAEEYQAKLTLLHVVEDHGGAHHSRSTEYMESAERELRSLVPEDSRFWCAPHFLVEHGRPADKILELSERLDSDLIVLGIHKEEGLPGAATHLPIATAHHILARAKCPVLTIRG